MVNTTLAVLTIVAIAAMMGASSVAPAYAAVKTTEYDKEFKDDLTQRRICGESIVDVERTIKTRTTEWDNGKFKLHITIAKKFFDRTDGDLLGQFHSTHKYDGKDIDAFVSQSFQHNETFTCLNGEGKWKDTGGFTVDKDGNIKWH